MGHSLFPLLRGGLGRGFIYAASCVGCCSLLQLLTQPAAISHAASYAKKGGAFTVLP